MVYDAVDVGGSSGCGETCEAFAQVCKEVERKNGLRNDILFGKCPQLVDFPFECEPTIASMKQEAALNSLIKDNGNSLTDLLGGQQFHFNLNMK